MDPPAPRPTLFARLAGIARAELAEAAVLLAMATLAVIAIATALRPAGETPWAFVNGSHLPMWPRLASALVVSGTLVAGGLAVAIPLAVVLAWRSVASPAWESLRRAVAALSAIPLVAGGALVHLVAGDHALGPILLIGTTELTLGTLTSQLRAELARELAQDYVDTGRGAGFRAIACAWRPLVALVIATARSRVPYLLGATIVVERIFNRGDGLANLVFSSLERHGDPATLACVALIGVAAVRAMRLVEALSVAILDPRRDPAVTAALPAAPAPWVPSRPRDGVAGAIEAAADLPALVARLPRRIGRSVASAVRRAGRRGPFGLAASAVGAGAIVAAAALGAIVASGWLPAASSGLAIHASPDPGAGSYLGADGSGRDLATQLLQAGHNMLGPIAVAIALPLVVGVATGTWAACGRGWGRALVARGAEVAEALPRLVVLLAVLWVVPVDAAYLWIVFAAIGLVHWTVVHAAVRDRVARLSAEGFLEAQRALGASAWRAYGLHAVWLNGSGAVAVQAAALLGHVIVTDVSLGYLGYSQPDDDLASWGRLVHIGLAEPAPNPWVRWAPLACVSVVCIAAAAWADRAAEHGSSPVASLR